MSRLLLFFGLFTLALVVVGISLAILRSLHRSILLYVLFIPMWLTVLVVLVMVGRSALRNGKNG